MLYDLWCDIARKRGPETALWEQASGRRWRFCDLAKEAESKKPESGGWVYPQGNSAEFILAVLRAWRAEALVCPLEPEMKPLQIPRPPAPCCHLKITSGTSGQARVVAFTPEQLAADARNIIETMGLRPEWPNVGAISLAHSYGFSNLVLPLLLQGIPLILAASPLPEIVKTAASSLSEVTLPAVPTLWRAWREANAIPPSVRLAISAGAPLGLDLEDSVHRACGLKIHNFYGCSECGGIAYDDSPSPRDNEAYVGQAMDGVEVAVGVDGCLEIRSEAVGQTYWPEADDHLGAGVFRTSDLAEIKDGRISLRGRLGDQINVAGRKVAPQMIEQVLNGCPGVSDCLVFGVPGGQGERNDVIVACVVGDASPKQLKQFLLEKLSAWQVPREWWLLESLQANERGKLSRAEWASKYMKQRTKLIKRGDHH
jgi:acyl-CoA synthetase (AMP-forming)/AMP-acid ligase II